MGTLLEKTLGDGNPDSAEYLAEYLVGPAGTGFVERKAAFSDEAGTVDPRRCQGKGAYGELLAGAAYVFLAMGNFHKAGVAREERDPNTLHHDVQRTNNHLEAGAVVHGREADRSSQAEAVQVVGDRG